MMAMGANSGDMEERINSIELNIGSILKEVPQILSNKDQI